MLTDEETREIQAEFVNYENRRAVCLDASGSSSSIVGGSTTWRFGTSPPSWG